MRFSTIVAAVCLGLTLAAGEARATSVTCMSSGDLQNAINNTPSGQTLTVSGTCTGTASIGVNNITLQAASPGSTEINAQVNVFSAAVTIIGFIIDGTGVSGGTEGVVVQPSGSATLENDTIQHWSGDGVDVNLNASAGISGGTITNNSQAGIFVGRGGAVALGFVPNLGNGASQPVTITSNGTNGINGSQATIAISNGSITNNAQNGLSLSDHSTLAISTNGGTATAITGNDGDGIDLENGSQATIDQVNLQSNSQHGIQLENGSSAAIGTGTIASNGGFGIKTGHGSTTSVGSSVFDSGSPTQITSNQSGGVETDDGTLKTEGVSIFGNTGGPAVYATLGTANLESATIAVSSTAGEPAILSFRSSLFLQGDTITGATNSYTIVAASGSSAVMTGTSVTSAAPSLPTILVGDASVLDSLGGNTIDNTASSGVAMTVANASTFHQIIPPLSPFPASADTITGGGTVQMQSNMELGTGSSATSTWNVGTAGLSISQNSSFRMDGGMTITGNVKLIQGSNGFFNAGAGGRNTVMGGTGVTCPFSTTQDSHVAGNTFVFNATTGSTSAVTIGNAAGNCLGF